MFPCRHAHQHGARVSKLLIDADGIVYRAGFAMEKSQYLITSGDLVRGEYDDAKSAKAALDGFTEGSRIWSRKETKDEEEALMLTSIIVRDIRDRYPNLDPVLWLTPSVGNFRDRIATRAKYKGNRDSAVRPTHHKAIRNYLVERYGATESVGQEADDALGIDMTANPGSVLVSYDKDLLQVPGLHYNWVKKEETIVTPRGGQMTFFRQILSGDATDNVPGVPGIGPAKAAKILEGVKSQWEAWTRIVETYAANGLTEKDALETARLVYVRRREGELWQSPRKP